MAVKKAVAKKTVVKKAKKPVIDIEAFQAAFVASEKVMKENLIKLIESKLKKETNFDARMAYKTSIKLIRTGTLNDIDSLDSTDSDEDINDGNQSKPQG